MMSALTDIQTEIARLIRATVLLSDFEDKHRDFLKRCSDSVSVSGVGISEPSIAFYKDVAGDIAQYFGNDGWSFGVGRRAKKVDGVEIAVIGIWTEDAMQVPSGPLFAQKHLSVVASDVGHANVETIEGSTLHGRN